MTQYPTEKKNRQSGRIPGPLEMPAGTTRTGCASAFPGPLELDRFKDAAGVGVGVGKHSSMQYWKPDLELWLSSFGVLLGQILVKLSLICVFRFFCLRIWFFMVKSFYEVVSESRGGALHGFQF